MNDLNNKNESGLIGLVIIIVIGVALLGYFGVDIRRVTESEGAKANVSYVATTTVKVWNNYLKEPSNLIWREFVVGLVWERGVKAFIKSDDSNSDTETEVDKSAEK